MNKPLTKEALVGLVLGGSVILVGEFRGAALDSRKWTDRVNGRDRTMNVMEVAIETANPCKQVTVTAFEESGKPLSLPEIKKGSQVAILIRSRVTEKGHTKTVMENEGIFLLQ